MDLQCGRELFALFRIFGQVECLGGIAKVEVESGNILGGVVYEQICIENGLSSRSMWESTISSGSPQGVEMGADLTIEMRQICFGKWIG